MATPDAITAPKTALSETDVPEEQRLANLLEAQNKAAALFADIARDMIRPGISEKQLTDAIYQVGRDKYNVRTHWHRRLVRSGPHTLAMFSDTTEDRVLAADDILYVDLGPVFEAYEADFGRTFVLGDDPHKIALRDALAPLWHAIKAEFDARPDITGAQLYDVAVRLTREAGEASGRGWTYGNVFCGHLVGDFPHERIPNDKITLYMAPGNHAPLRGRNAKGQQRHWILEIYLRDDTRGYAGFFEQILTV
ncbi:hypothetical protein SPBR_03191 [Sporothrix brasiliensis 5110]|uniref:Peptidase M24 domain-containing protein n=1 Tax=Sporothrix brasiliensis 5110 TaxID=1398154 RepID=A0A0C2IUG6_9PEZI|nr:uncharacterized protein SPBR_03191 [Sporothrix brasiliensis 5110]KIH92781.1 hypothetical protein SPBR_03191 [Sporothrix brasiliensis 5110]